MRRHGRLRGFTLIELLVVMGIIAILVTLLLPAVQQAREAARRSQCKNNISQLGLALLNYEINHGVFPPGWIGVGDGRASPQGDNGFAWGTLVLQYVDQRPLLDRLDFELPMDATANTPSLSTVIPTFSCPSQGNPGVILVTGRAGASLELGAASYVGCFGTGDIHNCAAPPGTPPVTLKGQCRGNGAFFHNSDLCANDIRDGSSNTILIGERSPAFRHEQSQLISTWTGALPGTADGALLVVATTAQPPKPGNPDNFQSAHAGGAQFALADGSVRFISENIHPDVFRGLGTIAGGETIGDF